MIRACALAVLISFGAVSVHAQEVSDEPLHNIDEHLRSPLPIISTPWVEAPTLSRQAWAEPWLVMITVDERGAVVGADVQEGPRAHRDEVIAATRSLQFSPAMREGRPVQATYEVYLGAHAVDYVGPSDRAFPERVDLARARIRLERTACFGACPNYRVEVRGDGEVIYDGASSVLIGGEHRWRIPQANVHALLALMRQADYFRLNGYYEIDASDLPTFLTGLDIGDQRKFVLNYGGSGMGGAVASTMLGPATGSPMPPAVGEIENAIDELSGVRRFVFGDETTMDALRAERFNFRSRESGAAMGSALAQCNMPLARAFLAEGAPANVTFAGWGHRQPIVTAVPRCGDVHFARALDARGALRRPAAADAFLAASARSGYPEMVRLALTRSRAVNQRDDIGWTLLMEAADAMAPEPDDPGALEGFDRAAVVSLLLEAGADARAHDERGAGALHYANDADMVRLLIAASADPNVQDGDGRTALFGAFDADAARALIAGGADVRLRDHRGRTALFDARGGEVVPILLSEGLDVNARDDAGYTPLEFAGSEDVARALIAAGARLPNDPQRAAQLLTNARRLQWTALIPLFEEQARALGVPEPPRE